MDNRRDLCVTWTILCVNSYKPSSELANVFQMQLQEDAFLRGK